MEFEAIAQMLIGKWPVVAVILSIMGALVVVGMAVVAITPSKKDDQMLEDLKKNGFFAKILEFLSKWSPFQKKS